MKVAAKFVGYCRRQVETMNSQIVTPTALPSCLLKIINLAERKGGTVNTRDVGQSFNIKHRPTKILVDNPVEFLKSVRNFGHFLASDVDRDRWIWCLTLET
jgi:hypothetical protein